MAEPPSRQDREEPHSGVTVTPRRDGPIVIAGPITLTGPDGTVEQRPGPTFLCRCGASETKPLCDGSHKRCGFTAPGITPPRKRGP